MDRCRIAAIRQSSTRQRLDPTGVGMRSAGVIGALLMTDSVDEPCAGVGEVVHRFSRARSPYFGDERDAEADGCIYAGREWLDDGPARRVAGSGDLWAHAGGGPRDAWSTPPMRWSRASGPRVVSLRSGVAMSNRLRSSSLLEASRSRATSRWSWLHPDSRGGAPHDLEQSRQGSPGSSPALPRDPYRHRPRDLRQLAVPPPEGAR